jgi:hypothetical protein
MQSGGKSSGVLEERDASIVTVEEETKKETNTNHTASGVPPKRRLDFNLPHGVTSHIAVILT